MKTVRSRPLEAPIDAWFHSAMLAAWSGNVGRFEALLDETPELVTRRSSCSHPTLLQFVVLDGGTGKIAPPRPFIDALVERGADLDEPLVAAASIGSVPIASYLLSAGASVEAGAPWTPLEESVYWAHRELAGSLRTRHGAQVRSLRVAAGLGDVPATRAFLDDGGPVDGAGPVRFPWGAPSDHAQDVLDQALVIAAKNGQPDTVRILLGNNANANSFPPGIHEHGGPLHMAAMLGRRAVVELLLDAGADPSLPDPKHGSTAAGWARHGGHPDLADLLSGSSA